MESLQRQVQFVSQALQCSATLEHVSPNMRICHLAIPWCGRQLHWQVLLPAPPHSSPDLLFDDDSFNPLCGLPLPHYPHAHLHPHSHALEPGRPGGSSQAALRALLRNWSVTPAATAAAAVPHPTSSPRAASAVTASAGASDRLCRLVSLLLEAYREHQLARLTAAAAALPRLQFELSTLELGPGMQMELQQLQQQAVFSLRLPPLDLRRLLELAELYGATLPPSLQPTASQPEQPQPQFGVREAAAQLPGAGSVGAAGGGREADVMLNPLLSGGGPHSDDRSCSSSSSPSDGHAGRPAAAAAQQQRPLPSGLEFALLATFRLPITGGSGDLADPELTLQRPRVLQELKAQEAGAAAGGRGSASTSGSGGASTSGSGGGPSLVPSFLLPLWSAHMCLAEYVPLAVERLQAQLDAHCGVLAARQQLFEHLAELVGPPLELNMRGGSGLFVVAWEGSPVLVSLELGPRFPADKPAVVLQCARVLPGADSSRTYRDYPWSPRWAAGEMAARIHNWLKEELPSFLRGRVPQA